MHRPRRARRCILEFIRYLRRAPLQETSHDEISADLHARLLGHLYIALNLTGILTFARIFGGFAIAMTLACVNAHAVPYTARARGSGHRRRGEQCGGG